MRKSPTDVATVSEYIENPDILEENTTPVHVPSIPYESPEQALEANEPLTDPESRWEQSPYFESLNGEWDFCWAKTPGEVPDRVGDESAWDPITVPSVWQLQGHGRPIYRNHALTWEGIDEIEQMPSVPSVPSEFNPVGTYRRQVSVPSDWEADRRTYLHFGGVKSAFFVWIDGEYVGYDQGSMTPTEFEVSDLLDSGSDHTLTVQVFRFSDGSYLETQDMIRFSGIFRSVYLYSKPQVHLQDFTVRTQFDDAYEDATLTVDAQINRRDAISESDDRTLSLVATLYDRNGQAVSVIDSPIRFESGTTTTTKLEAEIESPQQWSAEDPTLYNLVLEIRTGDTNTAQSLEAVLQQVGFREFEIRDGIIHVNGKPETIRGVNRHEHDPQGGRTVPFDRTLADLKAIKQANNNAIRAAHYPNALSTYVLADELGLYVIDEANVETHFDLEFVNDHPEFHDSFLTRFRRMVDHHKNFTSIFAWSTSNEAGTGRPHEKMAEYAREVDGTRFVFHQGSGEAPYEEYHESMTGTAPFTDISGPRYPVPYTLAQHNALDDRPLVMGEYGHALGNNLGLQDSYWSLVEDIDRLQGGFIWEWSNQTLDADVVPDAGGPADSGEHWYDGDQFLLDGIVFADGTPKPGIREVKKTQQPFSVDPVQPREGVVTITNRHHNTNLDAFETTWELSVDGVVRDEGSLDLDVPPGETRGVIVPVDDSILESGHESCLTIRVKLAEATLWADAGHEIGFAQIEVPTAGPSYPSLGSDERITLRETDDEYILSTDTFTYRFDPFLGRFSELTYGDETIAFDGPRLSVYRAPLLNEGRLETDTVWGYENQTEWEEIGLDSLVSRSADFDAEQLSADHVRITSEVRLENPDDDVLFDVTYQYDVYATGDIVTTVQTRPTEILTSTLDAWLPRIGVDFDLDSDFSTVEWYGRGPEETYSDRKSGAEIGRYAGDIRDQFIPSRMVKQRFLSTNYKK